MSLISRACPPFTLPAVSHQSPDPFHVALADFSGHWLLLMFYSRDFSFVCPTELTSFSARRADFEQRNCRLLGLSIDSVESHREWLAQPVSEGGVGRLQFPLVSDTGGELSKKLGIYLDEAEVAGRGLFLIDPDGVIQYMVVHNLSVGRSVEEILRVLDAMQSGGLCPASWTNAEGVIDPQEALKPGRVLGHYRMRELLGEGTFGFVFSAWDMHLERLVALKVLKQNSVQSRRSVLSEARAPAALAHPNICRVYAVEEQDGLLVIAMEHLAGRPLSVAIGEGLSLQRRIDLARGIASGLAAAHALNVVHGDLKPGNILVDDHQIPRIVDFGLARQTKRAAVLLEAEMPPAAPATQAPSAGVDLDATVLMQPTVPPSSSPGSSPSAQGIAGTPAYMAPEQWRNTPATASSDVFAFGLIFYELLTGRRALPARGLTSLLAQLNDPRFVDRLSADIPARYRQLLFRTLACEPADRPAAAALLQMLG